MATNKFYQVKKEIGGRMITAQFNGISAAVSAIDDCSEDGTLKAKLFGEYILNNVIVDPKGLTFDDFDTMKEYNEVITFGRKVMQGEFREETHAGAAETKGKK